MAESAIWIDLGASIGHLVHRAIMLMHVVSEMRRLRRLLLMLAIAGRCRESGVQA